MKRGIDFPGVNVVFYCHDGNGNFIMGKRTKNTRDEDGRWDPGGGAVELGETIEGAFKREVREEYGTNVLDFEFLGLRDVHRVDENGNKTLWIAFDFKVLIDKKKLKNGIPDDHEEIGWFRLDNLPSPVHSQLQNFLKKYRKKLIG